MKVSFRNISKRYKGKYALKDFTTELQEGVYGLLGANGAGKTTRTGDARRASNSYLR